MRNITLKHLRIVAAIARTSRVQAASDQLGVTAPAVTIQLKQLEEELGLTLFDRARQGMMITTAGQMVLDMANKVEAVLVDSAQVLDALRGLRGGKVSVGVVSTAKYFAPAMLGSFHRLHPDIEISLNVGNRGDMIRALAGLEFDLVIMGLPPEGADVERAVIGDHPHVIIAPPDHKFARRFRIPLSDLANEPFLTREEGSGTRMLMQRIFADAQITPRTAMEMSSNETIKQAVMAGLGVAFLSGHTIATEVEMGRLAILDVLGLPARRQWQIVRHSGKQMMPASAALWAFLKDEGPLFLPPVLSHVRTRR